MAREPLYISKPAPSLAFEPAAVQFFCHDPELNHEIGGKIFGFDLAPLLLPEPNQRFLIMTHDGSCVRSADKELPTGKLFLIKPVHSQPLESQLIVASNDCSMLGPARSSCSLRYEGLGALEPMSQ